MSFARHTRTHPIEHIRIGESRTNRGDPSRQHNAKSKLMVPLIMHANICTHTAQTRSHTARIHSCNAFSNCVCVCVCKSLNTCASVERLSRPVHTNTHTYNTAERYQMRILCVVELIYGNCVRLSARPFSFAARRSPHRVEPSFPINQRRTMRRTRDSCTCTQLHTNVHTHTKPFGQRGNPVSIYVCLWVFVFFV